ncbi:MAG: hypothetical protein V3W43_05675 [Desulfatiglandaceae bacterium]
MKLLFFLDATRLICPNISLHLELNGCADRVCLTRIRALVTTDPGR